MKKISLITALLMMILSIGFFSKCKQSKPVVKQTEGIIRGYVYADVSDNQKREQVLLPDVTVTIKNDHDSVVDEVLTRLDGNYATKHLKYGKYKICLSKNGFILTCYDAVVEYASNHPGPLQLNYNTENYIWGTVKLRDGTAGYYSQQVFGVNIDTKVGYVTNAGNGEVRCNMFSYYLLPGVNAKDKGKLKANCENSEVTAELNGQRRIDLTFRNSNPKISSIVAFNDHNRALLRTSPGKKLKLVAATSDEENNPLHYKWIPYGNFPGFVSQDAPEVTWELPNEKGNFEMDMMVMDNFGGVAYRSYNIVSGDGSVSFSGTVINMDGSGPISQAVIKVNGQFQATTAANGYFSFKMQENDDERYVLNVIKPGYALCSKIYMNDAIQKEYRLITTTTETFDPTQDINVTERPDKYTKLEGNKANRSPAHVFIPKNSIVDTLGNLVNVPVTVSIRSLDITDANGQMPGNFGGSKGNKNVRLESFGATDVQVRDKANPAIKYNLASTAKAELDIPILSTQMAKATGKIAFWDYNETTGMWEVIGEANKTGNFFKGTTNKFSVLNADFEFTSGTYIVLLDNPSNSVFTHQHPISIKLYAPQASGGVVQGYHIVDDLQPSDLAITSGLPIVNLPANTVITIQIISNGTIINTLNPRTGPVVPGSVSCCPPPSPLPPYDPTVEQIKMLPDIVNLAQDQLDRFLTGELNDYGGANGVNDANHYYDFIGANSYAFDVNLNPVAPHVITFAEWKAKNGYNGDGTGDINTIYFNAGDLAFWRGMHQKTFNGTTSFYVSNFATDVDAIFNNVLANNANPAAAKTVCMEFSPITTGINITKFYVFNALGQLVNSANLDANNGGTNYGNGNGQKLVPGLCVTCHGGANLSYTGNPDITSAATLQAYFTAHPDEIPNFLPFDAKSFHYSIASGNTRADQEENLRKLNHKVFQVESPSTNTRTKAIIDFINASYNNTPQNVGQGFIDNAVVDVGGATNTWNTNTAVNGVTPKNFYVDVVGTSCRTCHISRTNPNIWWDTKQKFASNGAIMSFVCPNNGTKYMPNSKVTFLNFWTSEAPKRYEEVGKFKSNNAAACQ